MYPGRMQLPFCKENCSRILLCASAIYLPFPSLLSAILSQEKVTVSFIANILFGRSYRLSR